MKLQKNLVVGVSIIATLFYSCTQEYPKPVYQTKNVIILIFDGARYSETWGDSTFQYINNIALKLADSGCIYTNFYNNGPTYTLAGHTSISTGNYQEIDNTGNEFPQKESIFQAFNSRYFNDSSTSWIISSKGKLQTLANCVDENWQNNFMPFTNCGINGVGVNGGSRHDSITFKESLRILSENHPRLTLISFREPDYSAHQGKWAAYTKGISDADKYIYQIWNFLQTDSIYKGNTTIFITNDHGRHLDGIADGFVSHGDGCDGCRHIFLWAYGPDFKKGQKIDINRELIDIPATTAKLLNLGIPFGKGMVMYELFK